MDMTLTGGEEYRYTSITSEYGIDSTPGGGGVDFRRGGGRMAFMAEGFGIIAHLQISQELEE